MKWEASHTDDDQDTDGHDSGHQSPASSDSHFEEGSTNFMYKLKHRVSCHRCGNMRKNRKECTRCPHVYCHQCEMKMVEEFGPSIFRDGCPVCKERCCCGKNRSFTCPRQHHCYKKCPATKRHSYKTATGFVTASKRCMKNRFSLHDCIPYAGDEHSHPDNTDHAPDDISASFRKADTRLDNVRRSARISQLYTHNRRLSSYAEDSSDEHSDHEVHDSDGETSCGSSDIADHHPTNEHASAKRTFSPEDTKRKDEPYTKVMRITPSEPSVAEYDPTSNLVVKPESNTEQQQSTPYGPSGNAVTQDSFDLLDIDMSGLLDNFLDPGMDDGLLEMDEAFLQAFF